MKKLICTIAVASALLINFARASQNYICRSQNQIARITIGELKSKEGSYDICNGGVGDEMTNCRLHTYHFQVREAAMKLRVKEGYLNSRMELVSYASGFEGFDILLYKEYALHIRLKGSDLNPSLNIKVMAKGTRGNPVEVGNHIVSCKLFK